jgi:hypothetical protein
MTTQTDLAQAVEFALGTPDPSERLLPLLERVTASFRSDDVECNVWALEALTISLDYINQACIQKHVHP